jgi:hypothetical protein
MVFLLFFLTFLKYGKVVKSFNIDIQETFGGLRFTNPPYGCWVQRFWVEKLLSFSFFYMVINYFQV